MLRGVPSVAEAPMRRIQTLPPRLQRSLQAKTGRVFEAAVKRHGCATRSARCESQPHYLLTTRPWSRGAVEPWSRRAVGP
jgi:hypothetical protein